MKHPLQATLVALGCVAALASLAACGGGNDATDTASTQALSLDFDIVADGQPVRCASAVSGLGTGATAAQPKDLRFYVSEIKLVKADGSEHALKLAANDDWNFTVGDDAVSLIDLEDATGSCPTATGTAATNSRVSGTVPAGSYTGIRFVVGVPTALNHSDYATATRPLDSAAMAWSWQSGRKFAKIELTDPAGTAGTWTAKTFNFHLGSTGCTGNPVSGETVSCSAPNRALVKLAAFDPATQKIALDLKALLAGEDITQNAAGAAGCMSGGTDPECGPIFRALDLGWSADGTGSGLPLSAGMQQTAFKAIAR